MSRKLPFKKDTDTLNYLSSTRAVLQIVGLESVSFTCTDYPIPGLNLSRATQATPFTDIPLRGDKLQFSPMTISFLVSAKLENWRAIYEWLIGLSVPNHPRQFCDKPMEYTDAVLHLYTAQNNKFAEIAYKHIWPTSLGDLDLTTQQSQNDEIVATATFEYQYYEINFVEDNKTSRVESE